MKNKFESLWLGTRCAQCMPLHSQFGPFSAGFKYSLKSVQSRKGGSGSYSTGLQFGKPGFNAIP